MQSLRRFTIALLLATMFLPGARSQGFRSGSNGSAGALNVTGGITNIALPPDGILNYTTITIPKDATVRFIKNANNTPVYLLTTGDVSVVGIIQLDGDSGDDRKGGESGPGGYNGGNPGHTKVSSPPGAGYGPGAGQGGANNSELSGAGAASYATKGGLSSSTNKGAIYGSALLVPLVGGSGGGGFEGTPIGSGGGGGGGAILIASNSRIDVSGTITAKAGGSGGNAYNGGSGGAIRLVAPVVRGNGSLSVLGNGGGGDGRIRIDTLDRTGIAFSQVWAPVGVTSIGSMMMVFPTPLPQLAIIEVAGTAIPVGSGPVFVQLPFGSSPNREVKIQARDFNDTVPITVVLTPDNGKPISYRAEIDNRSSNPGTATVNVTIPVNVQTSIDAWTR